MSDFQAAVELGVDLMKDIVAAGYSFLKEKSKERDFWGAATSKYIGGLLERNSTIKVLTMREPQPLGDLVICAPVLAREAREQGKTRLAHWAHLVVHGSLHLAGFDHEQDADARRMERRERRVLAGLGFPDPYASPPVRRRAKTMPGRGAR